MRTVLAALALLFVLAPVHGLAEGKEPLVRCGKRYITVEVSGGNHARSGPLVFRRSDLRAIYAKGRHKVKDPKCVREAREKAGYESAEKWFAAGKSLREFTSLSDHCETVRHPDREFTLYIDTGKLPLRSTITPETYRALLDCLD